MRTSRIGAWLAAALLLLAGCGEASPGGGVADRAASSPARDTPVSSGPSRGAPPSAGGPVVVRPRSGLVDVRPQPFRAVEAGPDDRTLEIFFHGGVEECYGLDRVEVELRAKSVVVTLYTGRVAEAELCIQIAVEKVTRVVLDEPLRGRDVVDGAPGA